MRLSRLHNNWRGLIAESKTKLLLQEKPLQTLKLTHNKIKRTNVLTTRRYFITYHIFNLKNCFVLFFQIIEHCTIHFGLGSFSPAVSYCSSLCHRNPFEFCGWHPVWSQVSMCDVGGHPQPAVLLHQHDRALPGAWHHIYVSSSFYHEHMN